MVKIYDVSQEELIKEVASELKKDSKIKIPDWALFVKTGNNKERPPVDKDWWYLRTASIIRKVYLLGPIGVSKLRTKYGSKKNRGVRPEKFVKASGKIIRVIFQQLESAGLIKKEEKSVRKGRIIASKGASLLDKAAGNLFKKTNTKISKPEVTVKKEEVSDKIVKDTKEEVKENKKE